MKNVGSYFDKSYTIEQRMQFDISINEIPKTNKNHIVCFEKFFYKHNHFIKNHKINSNYIFPAVLYLELLSEAIKAFPGCNGSWTFKNILLNKPLILHQSCINVVVQCTYNDTDVDMKIFEGAEQYCQGKIVCAEKEIVKFPVILINEIELRMKNNITKEQFYQDFSSVGFSYGREFKSLDQIKYSENEALAYISAEGLQKNYQSNLNLSVLESGMQAAGYAMQQDNHDRSLYVPFEIKTLRIGKPLPEQCYVYIRVMKSENNTLKKADILYCNSAGEVIAEVNNYVTMPVRKKNISQNRISNSYNRNDVAIIGVSGKMPSSKNLNIFWDNLIHNENMIVEVPKDRFDINDYYGDPVREDNKTNCKWGGFLENIKAFDNNLFRVSKVEANYMDPQQRMLLENVWSLIEDSGYKVSSFFGSRTGVYIGTSNIDYLELIQDKINNSYVMLGNNHPMIPNRISHMLDLKGPSEPIDTLCSSSLVALYRAVEDIKNGHCDQAIVGAVNLIISPRLYISYANARMLSPTGRCNTFDEEADGFIRGEGIITLLLKPIAKALEDKDDIYAIIKGISVQHQGKSLSLTSPNVISQAEVICDAIQKAAVVPTNITYIETHGSGTQLGDVVEINGLKSAFELLGVNKKNFCYLSAVKSQVGHLESAAGLAGIVKVLLAMKKGLIPANHNLCKLNSQITIQDSPFIISRTNEEWVNQKDEDENILPRIAGVSSFGAGGVNAHVVLEDYGNDFAKILPMGKKIFVLSALTPKQLRGYTKRMYEFLLHNKEQFENILYTLQLYREVMPTRLICIANNKEEIMKNLKIYLENQTCDNLLVAYDKSYNLWAKDQQKEQIVDCLIEGDYEAITKSYLKGENLQWEALYNGKKYSRVKLPSYQFERQEFWYDENLIDSYLPKNGAPYMLAKEWFIRKEIIQEESESLTQNILLFCNSMEDADNILLSMQRHTCFIILPGDTYEKVSSYTYRLDINNNNDYIKLLDNIKIEGNHIDSLILCSNFSNMQKSKDEFLKPITNLLKACFLTLKSETMELYYVILKQEKLSSIDEYALEAFLRSFVLENKYFKASIIILNNLKEQTLYLTREIEYKKDKKFKIVMMKEKDRFEKKLLQMSIYETKSTPIKRDETYIVTGGTGKIGMILVNYLVNECGAKVIILGRSNLQEKTGEQYANNLGKHIQYFQVDVIDLSAMQKIISNIKAQDIKISGVFHLAGISNDKRLEEKSYDEIKSITEAKVIGIRNIDLCTADLSLDFFVAFSSITAVIGNAGQCDYAYANRYLDYYVQYRNDLTNHKERSGISISINWPLWADGGMQINNHIKNRVFRKTGLGDINTKTAINLLMEVINNKTPNVVVLAGDVTKIQDNFMELSEE